MSTVAWCAEHLPRLDGKTALVTGAASGLGFETALGLASLGAEVWICDRNVPGGEQAMQRIRSACPNAPLTFAELDLGDLTTVGRFTRRAAPAQLDILVNNAGLLPPCSVPPRSTASN